MNQQACTGRIHDNNNPERNPIRYHNQVGKIAVTITVMDTILFTIADTFFRSLCEVTTGVPSPANAKESAWISPAETEISRNSFDRF